MIMLDNCFWDFVLILGKLKKFRSDLDPHSSGSCLAPEPDPNEYEKHDANPNPNKVGSEPQHW